MWSQILDSGKCRYFERYRDPMTSKSRIVSVTFPKDSPSYRKKAAAVLQDKIRERMQFCQPEEKENITIHELAEMFLEERKNEIRESTYRRDKFMCKSFERIFGADTLVDKLNAGYISNCLNAEKDKSASYKNSILKRLKSMLRWGYQKDLVERIDYLEKLKPVHDPDKKEKLLEKYLEQDELKKVLEVMPVDKWKRLTELLALTGMRIGEALALTIDDVDLSERVIHITKTYDVNAGRVQSAPKTSDSYRDIYIQDQLYPVVKKMRYFALACSMITGYRTFCQDEDGRFHYDAYRIALRRATETVTGKALTPHSLRHTHTSLLAAQGVSLDVISRRLGHSDSQITKQIYFHVTEGLIEKDRNELKNVQLI